MNGKKSLKSDALAKHFVQFCEDCHNSNQVRARLKEIVEPTMMWQGERICRYENSQDIAMQKLYGGK